MSGVILSNKDAKRVNDVVRYVERQVSNSTQRKRNLSSSTNIRFGRVVEPCDNDHIFVGNLYNSAWQESTVEGDAGNGIDVTCSIELVDIVESGMDFCAVKKKNRWWLIGLYSSSPFSSEYPSSEFYSSDTWSSAHPSSMALSSAYWSSAEEPSSDELSSQTPSSNYYSSAEEPSSNELSSNYWSSAEEPSSQEISSDYWSSDEEPSSNDYSSGEEPSSNELSSQEWPWSSDSPSSDELSSDTPSSDWPSTDYISSANSSELSSDSPSSDEPSSDAPSSDAVSSEDWYDCTPDTIVVEFEGVQNCGTGRQEYNVPPAAAINGIHVLTKESGCTYVKYVSAGGSYQWLITVFLDDTTGSVRVSSGFGAYAFTYLFPSPGGDVHRNAVYSNDLTCSTDYIYMGHNGKVYIY